MITDFVQRWTEKRGGPPTALALDGGVATKLFSYDNMTACVRAGAVHPIGSDGEVGV